MSKVKGEENLADALTKYVDASNIKLHSNEVGLKFESGRHPLMPHVD